MSDPLIAIRPSREIFLGWRDELTTERDIWFLDAVPGHIAHSDCQVMTRREYLDNPTYSAIEYVNAYWHWRILPEVTHVINSPAGWIDRLSAGDREFFVQKQVELGRGLIFPRSHFDALPRSLEPFVVGDKIVLTRDSWESVDEAGQFTALSREALLWDDSVCFSVPHETQGHVAAIANTWSGIHGSNCLGTTAYCVTQDKSHLLKWMFQEEFSDILDEHGYAPINEDKTEAGDVLVFLDDGVIVHAAFCVGPDRFLNKNGQSMFNPIRVVNSEMLAADWREQAIQCFRINSLPGACEKQ